MTCHAQRPPTLCIVEGLRRYAIPNFFQLSVLFKGYNGILPTTSFDHVWFPRATGHAKLDYILHYVLSKSNDGMPSPT